MKRVLLALFLTVSVWSAALAQGGMMPGPGTVHSVASAPAFNWVAYQNDSFPPQGTSTSVGSTQVGTACGTLTAGTSLVAGIQLMNELSDTFTPPAGWSQIGTSQTSASSLYAWFIHIVGASETCAYSFSWTGNVFNSWVIANFNGTNGTTPTDASSTTAPLSAGGTTAVCPATGSLSNASSPDVLALMMMTDDLAAVGTTTVPSDMTSRALTTQGGGLSIFMVATKALPSPVATTETITGVPNFKKFPCLLVALKP